MSELKLVSPLLDGFVIGSPMSDHDGICCYPAMKENTDEKYIVKVISVPASQIQLDALLLTGAYKDPAEATDYFKETAESISAEVDALNMLAKLEGFLPYEGCQIVPMEDGRLGYQIYLLSSYKRSLLRYMRKKPITHLDAVNLGLDLCAALSICRRAGYMYVDLKPSNIFLSREKQYRIGDLGLVKLDSLAFTSLPGKYRSTYTPREVQDDMKVLNNTVDTYSVGMILYQIYNEGSLPAEPLEPTDPFSHPSNADYEIASIIMKALDPDPAKRWTDPMEMGQALVGYMQRNRVNNNPIVPPSGIVLDEPPVPAQPAETEPDEEVSPISDNPDTPAEEAPEQSAAVMQEPASADEAENEDDDDDDLDFSIAFTDFGSDLGSAEQPAAPEPQKSMPVRKERKSNKKGLVAALITLVILVCLGLGAFWFYQNVYLQPIDDLILTGSQHELTVTVKSGINMSDLHITCTDAYGNSTIQPLVNGQAVFTDLLPDSLYRIEVTVDGFHALTGKTAEIFTTDAMPTVISMSAVTGPEDGSVLLNFTVDGTDPEEWMLTCTTQGEENIVEVFTGHSVTVKGLIPGNIYTLTLGSANGDQILGSNVLDFTATRLVLAQNLTIADYTSGTMTVRWDAPENSAVETWNVRCYNDHGHEEVLEISGTEIAFTGIDSSKSYTVEVTAAGMTEPTRVTVSANPLTVTDIAVHTDDANQLNVTWACDGPAPEGGWILMYTLDGDDQQNVVKCDGNSAVVAPVIPSATYHFVLQAVDSTSVFNAAHSYTTAAAGIFNNEGLSADKITAALVKTPEQENWTIESIGDDAITDTFQTGDSISVVLQANDKFYLPEMDIDVLYVIRNSEGSILSSFISEETVDWKALWYDNSYQNGELTIPKVPTEPGNYSVCIYFNHQAVTVASFTITE